MTTQDPPVRICGVGDLPAEGKVREISAGKQTFCVARLKGRISALDNECPHHGGPLGQGTLERGLVVCPWHGYAFNAVTGACHEGSSRGARVYEISISGDDVLIQL